MNNTVTFETARALEEAGFPQPKEIRQGQDWYDRKGGLIHIGHNPEHPDSVMQHAKGRRWIFAPTAIDILQQLPGVLIVFEQYHQTESEFEVWRNGRLLGNNPNPHEAAALAYLNLKKPLAPQQ